MSADRAAALADPDEGPGAKARQRLAGFVRLLRHNGFAAGLAEVRDGLLVLLVASARSADIVRPALRALLCGRRSDWETFDALFDAFWLGRGLKVAVRSSTPAKAAKAAKAPPRALPQEGAPADAPEPPQRIERHGGEEGEEEPQDSPRGASRVESLAKADFRHITDPRDLAEAHELAGRLARAMRHRLTRRYRARRRGERLDLRRTIHRSIALGGTPIELVRRRRKHRPLRLVMLLDVSGSMTAYAPVFLRFMHGVLDAFREAETFLFHTRLMHVSPALREKDARRAVDRLALIATGIGGGTEIGSSLATFNRLHARRVVHSRTAVMVISDGYDTGEPERLAAEMQALRRRCRRIAWLNPMAGWDGYTPEARGMQAALPFVDLFGPAHNIESLLALEPFLARL